MAFLPLYVPGSGPLNVVIIGGGYAAMAALISLRRHCPSANITLIDRSPHHLKITHLHETFRRDLSEFVVPFATIAERFACRYIQADVDLAEDELVEWQQNRGLPIGDDYLDFDYLLIATGVGGAPIAKPPGVYNLVDFSVRRGSDLLADIDPCGDGWLTVVGGGATGIQFVFEIARFVRERELPFRLRLVDGEDAVLSQFAPELGRYVDTRMRDLDITYLPRTFYRNHEQGKVVLQGRDDGEILELDSCSAFLFPGKSPDKQWITNMFGQLMAGNQVLSRVFAAGDCSRYRGVGSNTLTAQAAVRKGKLAARNILRSSGRVKIMEPYLHRDLGYVISLGPSDAVGWLALEGNVVAGFPALVVKELVEAQYDLLLAGIDTYLI